jgi:conjugal transfer pilus assembly protein TraK
MTPHVAPLVTSLLAAALLALSSPAQALQIVDAGEGETALAKISRKEVTRIAFEHGRVRKVTGNAGEFLLEKDEERGAVFIRPASAESSKPINVFLSSERGTVGLLLQPVDIPGDTLVIRQPRGASSLAPAAERSERHVRRIKNLVLAMASDGIPEDMEVREHKRELGLWPGVRLTLQRAWVGPDIVGEKYLLANFSSGTLQLAEPQLYKPGVMAVCLEASELEAGEATNLFVIRERQPHD